MTALAELTAATAILEDALSSLVITARCDAKQSRISYLLTQERMLTPAEWAEVEAAGLQDLEIGLEV